jgi:hypothetical protein
MPAGTSQGSVEVIGITATILWDRTRERQASLRDGTAWS